LALCTKARVYSKDLCGKLKFVILKYRTAVISGDKRSSLLIKIVDYGEKKIYKVFHRWIVTTFELFLIVSMPIL
jgi:hypothetical protein